MAFLLATALASVVVVQDGEVLDVGLAAGGTLVQLPQFVEVVAPTPLEVTPTGAPERGVKHLQVRSRGPLTTPETVTFVLADGRAVALRFVPGKASDGFVDVRFPSPPPARDLRSAWLAPEREVLAAMLRDDTSTGRTVNEEVEYAEYPELTFRLLRVHQGTEGVVGYTFELVNQLEVPLTLHPEVLSVGWPNRAALVQTDHDELVPCSKAPAWAPGRPSCRTALRLVVRDEGRGALGGRPPAVRGDQPFVLVQPPKKEKR